MSGVCEVVGALVGGEGSEELADPSPGRFEGARVALAREGLEPGENLFDAPKGAPAL